MARPPRSLVRQALALARIRQPLAARIHRRRVAGHLVDVCPDCAVPLTAGVCPACPSASPVPLSHHERAPHDGSGPEAPEESALRAVIHG